MESGLISWDKKVDTFKGWCVPLGERAPQEMAELVPGKEVVEVSPGGD